MRKKGMILAALILLLMFPFSGAWAVSMVGILAAVWTQLCLISAKPVHLP